jgi:dCMP deaminase
VTARLDRDQLGLALARVWSLRGTCARRQVGCVLWDARGRELATGYNGPARGRPHCIDSPCAGAELPSGTGLSTCEAIHAEANALLRCADVLDIHTVFCTVSPCLDCVKLLLNTSARRIVFAEEYSHPEARLRWLGPTSSRYHERTWEHVPLVMP